MASSLEEFCKWWNSALIGRTTITDEHVLALSEDMAHSFRQKFSPSEFRPLGCSELGKPAVYCAARWLKLIEPKRFSPYACAIFLTGDFIECLLIQCMKAFGLTVYDEQAEIDFFGIKGHIDCMVNDHLVEIKTMSYTYMTKFLRLQDDERGYSTQLHVYNHVKKPKCGSFWMCYNKATSELRLIELDVDEGTVERAKYICESLQNIHQFDDIQDYFDIPEPEKGDVPDSMADVGHLFYRESNKTGKLIRLWK